MISEPESAPPESASIPRERTSWRVIAAGLAITFFAITWFLVSRFAMHATVADSFGEAVGVALGFLVAFSVLGAILSARSGD